VVKRNLSHLREQNSVDTAAIDSRGFLVSTHYSVNLPITRSNYYSVVSNGVLSPVESGVESSDLLYEY